MVKISKTCILKTKSKLLIDADTSSDDNNLLDRMFDTSWWEWQQYKIHSMDVVSIEIIMVDDGATV